MPDDIVEREVLGEASRACGVLVERVRGRVARKGGATAGELSHYAAAAFEAYAETLLRALMAAASRREGGDVEGWVRRRFHDGLDSAGTPLREAVADSPHRHTVAQGLQQKMFEAELMLRRALKARFSDAPLVGIRNAAESGVETHPLQRKAAG
jgi:DNA-directed RNA polymerase specialized sigma24 family protein